jgi:flagellin-like hook-associated protein FlgL
VAAVSPILIRVTLGQTPILPGTATVTYDDKTTGSLAVTWDAVNPDDYAEVGEFVVEGAVEGVVDVAAAGAGDGAFAGAGDGVGDGAGAVIKAVATIRVLPYLVGAPTGTAVDLTDSAPIYAGLTVPYRPLTSAFDDSVATSVMVQAGNSANGRYLGLDLGAGGEAAIGLARVYVVPGTEAAFAGAQIQGSNASATGTQVTLATMEGAAPGWNDVVIDNPAEFRWYRIVKMVNFLDMAIAEMQLYPWPFHAKIRDAISDANDILNDALVAENAGDVPAGQPYWLQEDWDKLEAAIRAAGDGLKATARADIDDAVSALASAVDEFENAAKNGTYKTLASATPSAFVTQLAGNQNRLTISVKEIYTDGSENVVTSDIMVDNNAAGTYAAGAYKVYVNVKGNTQVRECYLVE